MNVNVKLSISDEDRNLMSRRLTGKDSKKMVSRAEVNHWVKEQLEKFLRLGSPTTEQVDDLVDDSPDEPFFDDPDYASDLSERDIEDVMKRNELLQHRVNVLQHRLDTTR